MAGRKVFDEELKIKERYSALSDSFFKVLKEALESGEKAEKKWAVEQLNKAFIRMIPQQHEGGDPEKPIPILLHKLNKIDEDEGTNSNL